MTARYRAALLIGAVVSLCGASTAWGSGGGGGGGGELPSISAPSYDPAAEYQKAVQALNAGDFKGAARALNHVTEAAPENPEAWRLLGVAKSQGGDWKGARRAYQKAVRYAPDSIEAHRGLGVAMGSLKDPKAQGELDWLNGRLQACAGCSDASALQAAASAVQSAMSGGPQAALVPPPMLFSGPKSGDAAYVQAVSLINDKRYDEALAALDRAREAFGPHPDILTYEGYAWRKKGAFDRAETYYRQALAIAPAHRGATEYYGELKVERGDMAGAKAMLARLDAICVYDCAEAEELRRWIAVGRDPAS